MDNGEFTEYTLEEKGYELLGFFPKQFADESDSLEAKLIFHHFNYALGGQFDIRVLKAVSWEDYCKKYYGKTGARNIICCTDGENQFAVYILPKNLKLREQNIRMFKFRDAYYDMLAEDEYYILETADKNDSDGEEDWFFKKYDYAEDFNGYYDDEDSMFWDEEAKRDFQEEKSGYQTRGV